MKVLVTPRSVTKSGHPSLQALTDAGYEVVLSTPGCFPSEDELITLLPDCVGYLAGVEPVTAKVLEAAGSLKAISRNGTGVDSIDMDAAQRQNITVCRAQGANARGVAELTFSHILSAVRSLNASNNAMKQEGWERRKGIELEGRTIGIVGCGKIGQYVAQFALGFDMKVLAFDPYPSKTFKPAGDFSYASYEEILEKSDVITFHCPPAASGEALIGHDELSKMKHGVYIINTARGSLLDQDAILAGLDSGQISGLAVDAFESEPPSDWRLVKHPQVIASPHIGGFTEESVARAMSSAVDNLLEALK